MIASTTKRDMMGSSFRFWVELDGLFVAGFSEVSGLEAETETEEYEEGGYNDFVHVLPKRTRYGRIVLKRGMTTNSDLWEWYEAVMYGEVNRLSGSIVLLNHAGEEVSRWNFYDTYPVKWYSSDFNSNQSELAVEAIELVHHGLKPHFKGQAKGLQKRWFER